jgi:hypothetical protein
MLNPAAGDGKKKGKKGKKGKGEYYDIFQHLTRRPCFIV